MELSVTSAMAGNVIPFPVPPPGESEVRAKPPKDVRVIVCGGPRTGKTTLAEKYRQLHPTLPVYSTDAFKGMDWSKASDAVVVWMEAFSGAWLIEGVASVRAIRKFLHRHPDRKPADVVFRLTRPFVELSPGQASMAKGEETIWREVEPELRRRGVQVKAVHQ